MDAAIIDRWNNVIKKSDTCYVLGDVTLGGIDVFRPFIDALNGNIRIVPGGHDYRWLEKWKDTDRVKVLPPLYTLEVPMGGERPQVIVLSHWPMLTWDRSHYNSWQIFGHEHGTLSGKGKQIDVGVDVHNFYPVSLDQVATIMATRPDNFNLVKKEIA